VMLLIFVALAQQEASIGEATPLKRLPLTE
jgi:hypothetical protein